MRTKGQNVFVVKKIFTMTIDFCLISFYWYAIAMIS